MDRREFMGWAACGLAGVALGTGCESLHVLETKKVESVKGKVLLGFAGAPSCLRVLDLDTTTFTDVKIPLSLPHSFLRNRKNPDEVFAFEVYGSMAKVNVATGETTLVDHTDVSAKSISSGHGIQTRDGDTLLCTEFDRKCGHRIVARRVDNLEIVSILPEEFSGGHHIVQLPHSTIAVSQAGPKFSDIAFYDYVAGKILSRSDFNCFMSHLMPISDTEVVGTTMNYQYKLLPAMRDLCSSQRTSYGNMQIVIEGNSKIESGPLHYATLGGEKSVLWDEEKRDKFKVGFGLSLIPGSTSFLNGYAGSDAVILWKDFKVEKIFSVPEPFGITVTKDGRQFLVVSRGTVKVFSLETYQEVRTIAFEKPIEMLSAY